MNIIGISGRSGSGKDLVASIIQYLDCCNNGYEGSFNGWLESLHISKWHIKKYADSLKDIVCILIGCTRKDLEDRNFKETELGEEWRVYYKIVYEGQYKRKHFINKEQYDILHKVIGLENITYHTEILTPRKLMLTIGTECGREMIHPNLWINAMFSKFKPYSKGKAHNVLSDGWDEMYGHKECSNCGNAYNGYKRQRYCKSCIEDDTVQEYPFWIISDVRFPVNEGNAITNRGGINIGIKRKFSLRYPEYSHLTSSNKYSIPRELGKIDFDLYKTLTHSSEELMNDFEWCDYVVENNETIDHLIKQIKEILIKENLING